MKVILQSLTLTNFRGVRNLTVDFETQTTIFGDNRTGKTSVYNAFLWMLFGKDNQDRKDHEIKTLGPDNQPYHRLDHEVAANLQINGEPVNVKRSYREKWVKKKGNTEAEFAGHETVLFWNDVPYKLEDFQAKVSSILKENVFKMITSTGYFNSIKWQDRRSILLELAGNIRDTELLQSLNEKNGGKYMELLKALTANKTIDEYKRELATKKKKIKDELDLVPSRIDEANRSLPDEKDYNVIEDGIKTYQEYLLKVDSELMDKTSAQKERQENITAKIKSVGDLRVSLNGVEFHIKNSVLDKRQKREQAILDIQRELVKLNDLSIRNTVDITTDESKNRRLVEDKAKLTARWHFINKETLVFDEAKFSCPTCKRAYEQSGIEEKKAEMIRNFNQDKSTRLSEIVANGKRIAAEIEAIALQISAYETKQIGFKAEIDQKQNALTKLTTAHAIMNTDEDKMVADEIKSNERHQSIVAQITSLQAEINAPSDMEENQGLLLNQKRELVTKIAELNKELSTKDQRTKILNRIAELKAGESLMAAELAAMEKIEFNIYEFTRAKMDEMEARINDRFRMVRFKLFREQVNGGQEECCETLIDGVPFGVANTGSQINAGLDIINVMSDHFDTHAPVFVDNRESVVTLIPSGSQIINLVVVPGALLSVNKIKYRKDFIKPELITIAA